MDSQNTKSPLTNKILSDHPEINNEPASRTVFYRMTLERYEAFFAEKRYSWSSVSDEEILRDIFKSIHESPGLCYISLLIRANSDLICTIRENLEQTGQNIEKNGIRLAEIHGKVSTVEKNLGNFSYQDFATQLSKFNTESEALQKVVGAYNDRLNDHIRTIDNLADKATVNNLAQNFNKFESDFGSVTAVRGFAGYVKKEFDAFRNGIGDTGKGSLSSQIDTIKSELEAQIQTTDRGLRELIQGPNRDGREGIEGNLKKLIQGPNLDGQGGLQGSINSISGLNRFIPALVETVILLIALYTGYSSLTGFIRDQVKDNLEAELNKEGGIQFQINQNTLLLKEISEKLDVKNETTPSPQIEEEKTTNQTPKS